MRSTIYEDSFYKNSSFCFLRHFCTLPIVLYKLRSLFAWIHKTLIFHLKSIYEMNKMAWQHDPTTLQHLPTNSRRLCCCAVGGLYGTTTIHSPVFKLDRLWMDT